MATYGKIKKNDKKNLSLRYLLGTKEHGDYYLLATLAILFLLLLSGLWCVAWTDKGKANSETVYTIMIHNR